jgi:hypothetical protein
MFVLKLLLVDNASEGTPGGNAGIHHLTCVTKLAGLEIVPYLLGRELVMAVKKYGMKDGVVVWVGSTCALKALSPRIRYPIGMFLSLSYVPQSSTKAFSLARVRKGWVY